MLTLVDHNLCREKICRGRTEPTVSGSGLALEGLEGTHTEPGPEVQSPTLVVALVATRGDVAKPGVLARLPPHPPYHPTSSFSTTLICFPVRRHDRELCQQPHKDITIRLLGHSGPGGHASPLFPRLLLGPRNTQPFALRMPNSRIPFLFRWT